MNSYPFAAVALAIKPVTIVLLVIAVLIIVGLIFLYRYGTKMQRKSEQSQAEMKAGAQTISLLVIDKKRLKLKEANLPSIVVEQAPRYLRGAKVPIVKVKVGPKVTNMMCDEKIFDLIPVKKEVKAVINGIYIMDVKGLRSGLEQKPQKVGFFKKMKNKITKKQKKA